MQRWMLGPDGWTMPVCDVAAKVGDSYRYEWENADESQRFGFEGELLERRRRIVLSRRADDRHGGPRHPERAHARSAVNGGTLLSIVITYPSKELRDMILGTGMTTGMETSYARLEREVLSSLSRD